MKGNYANGRIYKIEPICEHDENEVYYGSTCQLLCKRRIFIEVDINHGKPVNEVKLEVLIC